MSFAWPDPNASEEQKLIEQLQHIMYHRPGSPSPSSAPVLACSCHAAREAGTTPASGSESQNVEGADKESTKGPNVAYFDTGDPPATGGSSMRSPFDPEWDPKTPWFAPPSDSTTWYAVTVGKRVGVFDQRCGMLFRVYLGCHSCIFQRARRLGHRWCAFQLKEVLSLAQCCCEVVPGARQHPWGCPCRRHGVKLLNGGFH